MTQTLLFRSRFSCLAILMGTLCVFATGGQAQEKPAGREIRATQALEPQVNLEGRIQVSPKNSQRTRHLNAETWAPKNLNPVV